VGQQAERVQALDLSLHVGHVDIFNQKEYNRRKPIQEHIVRKLRLANLIGSLFPAIQGQMPMIADNGSMPDQISLINAILAQNPWAAAAFNAAANTTGFTASPSQIMGAEQTYLNLSGTLAAGAALTLPTVAALLATLTPQQAVVGSAIVLRIINSSSAAFAWTVTTNTGWTLSGTSQAIAQNVWQDYIVTITAIGTTPTATLQAVGRGDGPV